MLESLDWANHAKRKRGPESMLDSRLWLERRGVVRHLRLMEAQDQRVKQIREQLAKHQSDDIYSAVDGWTPALKLHGCNLLLTQKGFQTAMEGGFTRYCSYRPVDSSRIGFAGTATDALQRVNEDIDAWSPPDADLPIVISGEPARISLAERLLQMLRGFLE